MSDTFDTSKDQENHPLEQISLQSRSNLCLSRPAEALPLTAQLQVRDGVRPSTGSKPGLRRENVTITTVSVCDSAPGRAVSGGRSGGHCSSPRRRCFAPARGTATLQRLSLPTSQGAKFPLLAFLKSRTFFFFFYQRTIQESKSVAGAAEVLQSRQGCPAQGHPASARAPQFAPAPRRARPGPRGTPPPDASPAVVVVA